MKADYTTWCSDKMLAGVHLADILNEINDESLIDSVNGIFNSFDRKMKSLVIANELVVDINIEYFALLMRNDMKSSVIESNFPKEVETRILSVMTAKYRKALKIGKVHG